MGSAQITEARGWDRVSAAVAHRACASRRSWRLADAVGSGAQSKVPRTPDGKPDLQGIWDFRTHHTARAAEPVRREGDAQRRGSGDARAAECRDARRSGAAHRRPRHLQSVLVRFRQPGRRRQADVADRRPGRWPSAAVDARGREARGRARRAPDAGPPRDRRIVRPGSDACSASIPVRRSCRAATTTTSS